jgi:exonuclease VII small subunit
MPDHAKVTSLEAIESFRAKLIVFREKAGRALDEINDEVTRTRLWLQQDRIAHCEGLIRRCQRELEQRQQELFTARVSVMDDPVDVKQAAARKARQALRDAEDKLQRVRQWNRAFDQRVETPARQVETLRHIVDKDLAHGVVFLAEDRGHGAAAA